jgi:UDP-N-acetylmuramate dehydrogenase
MLISENISLKKLNTFGIDVKAARFVRVTDIRELQELLAGGYFSGSDHLILGGGSNLLFTRDYGGLVVQPGLGGIAVDEAGDGSVRVTAGAGLEWDTLVNYCLEHNYGGIENLALIPGSVGASPIQNIGAYGVELKDVFHSLKAFDTVGGEIRKFNKAECRFGYRDSVFKRELKGRYIITEVSLLLSSRHLPDISYGALREALDRMGKPCHDIRAVAMAVAEIRRSKLPDPAETGNAGSFFKNPVVGQEAFTKLQDKNPGMPYYQAPPGHYKLPAAWLIEQCGWKGKRDGQAGVHHGQPLVLVNHGGASGKDILRLAERIRGSVKERFGLMLETEVNIF